MNLEEVMNLINKILEETPKDNIASISVIPESQSEFSVKIHHQDVITNNLILLARKKNLVFKQEKMALTVYSPK